MNAKFLLSSAIALGCFASQAHSAVTVYTDRAAWEAAVGGTFSEQNFNSFTTGTSYQTVPVNVGDFSVSMTGSDFGFIWHNIGPDSTGNNVNGTPQINAATGDVGGTTLAFTSAIYAFGGNWAGISDGRTTSLDIDGTDFAIPNLNGGFWGVVSDAPFSSSFLQLTAGAADGFGLDNVVYANAATVSTPGTMAAAAVALGLLVGLRRRQEALGRSH